MTRSISLRRQMEMFDTINHPTGANSIEDARMRQRRWTSACQALAACVCMAAIGLALPIVAQDAVIGAVPPAGAAILNVVRWSGSLPQAAGKNIEMKFSLYQDQAGGLALWSETQTVTIGADGRYTVLLGATSSDGLPAALFQAGEARWIEARLVSGQADATGEASDTPARSLLAAVPYAFKSVDAENLAGRAAADYVTREDLQSAVAANVQTELQAQPNTSPSGSGTAGFVPLWTGAATLGNSVIAELGAKIGVGTPTPATTLDVNGAATVRGSLNLLGVAATATAAANSPALDLGASAYSSTSHAAVAQNFVWQARSSGNNTASPTANLALFFGAGTSAPAATGLSIAPNGQITFASGQKFPGTGTITGVTAASPLTGGGTSGSVSVGLNTSSLETTLNSVYAQLGAANTFTKPITFAPGQQFPGAGAGTITGVTSGAGLKGGGTSGSVSLSVDTSAVPLLSTYNSFMNGADFAGETTVSGSSTDYMLAVTNASPTSKAAILGQAVGNETGILGASPNGTAISGLTNDGTAIKGVATNGPAGYFSNDSVSQPSIFVSNVAGGGTGILSSTTTGYAGSFSNSSIGYPAVYATNTASVGILVTDPPTAIEGFASGTGGIGVQGISSQGEGGYFFNNNANYPALYVNGFNVGLLANSYGVAVRGVSGPGEGVVGVSTSSSGVQGYTKTGFAATLGQFGNGSSTAAQNPALQAGVWGDAASNNNDTIIGVVGTTDDGIAGYFVNDSSPWSTLVAYNSKNSYGGSLFRTFMAASPSGACGIGGNGDLACTGQVKALVSTGSGSRTVETYAVQSPENWMEDFGSGTLERGVAVVTIDPAFAETVSADASYHVFITPDGDSKSLYVINKTATSFEVRESGGGTSSLAFDYRIVARRRGYETQRLTDVTDAFNAAMKAAHPPTDPNATPHLHSETHPMP